MTCITTVSPAGEFDERTPLQRRFFKRSAKKAAPDVVNRQAALTLLAFQLHDQRDEALSFLNQHCDALGGRPIDVAGTAPAGLDQASAYLRANRSNAGN